MCIEIFICKSSFIFTAQLKKTTEVDSKFFTDQARINQHI